MTTTLQPSSATAKKRGRKAEHYRTSWDETVNGLARRPSDGRWRVIGTNLTFTEPDERLAIHKFRTLAAREAGEKIAIPIAAGKASDGSLAQAINQIIRPAEPIPGPVEAFAEYLSPTPIKGGTPIRIKQVPGERTIEFFKEMTACDAFYPWLRRFILENKKMVAEKTGIRELEWITELCPPAPLPTFNELEKAWNTYSIASGKQKRRVVAAWKDFVHVTGIEELDDITPEIVVAYRDNVYARNLKGKSQLHFFTNIRGFLRFAKGRAIAVEAISKILDSLTLLNPSESAVSLDPHPIEPADFKALLDKSEGDDKAMLLLMLNCALYLQEVVDLKWEDLKDGCLIAHRNKTGRILRIAVLWDETNRALAEVKRRGDHIFYAERGEPLTVHGAGKRFRKIRKAAGVSESVQASHLRDGSATAAAEANVNEQICRLLTGHRAGISDHYAKRRPRMVAPACEAIRQYYFGGSAF